jgi:hypothetical protein
MLNFYLDSTVMPKEIPATREDLWPNFFTGEFAWVLQTYLVLKQMGIPCQLTTSYPYEGVVVVHRDHLREDYQPTDRTLIVCVQADRSRHPWAQVHVQQNYFAVKERFYWPLRRFLMSGVDTYIRHWPQPRLMPRDPKRADKFENIGFFGVPSNLDPYFHSPEWRDAVKNLGLNWIVKDDPKEWIDYTDIDCVVAIRYFHFGPKSWKPPTKLFNSWLAHVPIILDPDSSYQAERKSDLDYLTATSPAQLIESLAKLKNSPDLRRNIEKNCVERSKEISVESIAKEWINAYEKVWKPYLSQWRANSRMRTNFLRKAQLDLWLFR